MDIAAVTQALQDIIDTDPTTTSRAAKKLADAARDTLDPLREFVNELDGYLADAEAAVDGLEEAERDEREDAQEALVGAVTELREYLLPDRVVVPAG